MKLNGLYHGHHIIIIIIYHHHHHQIIIIIVVIIIILITQHSSQTTTAAAVQQQQQQLQHEELHNAEKLVEYTNPHQKNAFQFDSLTPKRVTKAAASSPATPSTAAVQGKAKGRLYLQANQLTY